MQLTLESPSKSCSASFIDHLVGGGNLAKNLFASSMMVLSGKFMPQPESRRAESFANRLSALLLCTRGTLPHPGLLQRFNAWSLGAITQPILGPDYS